MDFLEAIKSEPLETVEYLLARLQAITTVNLQHSFYLAVKTAVTCQREDVVKLLLEKNCSLNQQDNTPLHIAAELGNTKIVQMLLEKRASIIVANEAGDTPLHVAFENKQMEVVDIMLNYIQQSSNYLDLKNQNGLSHLHIACERSNKSVVEGFFAAASDAIKMIKDHSVYKELRSTKDPKSENKKQDLVQPSKQVSVAANNLESLKDDLLEISSDSDDDNQPQKNQDIYATFRQIASMLHYDSKNLQDPESSEFHIVCGSDDPDAVKRYIRRGWNVNAPLKDLEWNGYPEDSTPLHVAVEERKDANVKILMEHGADVTLLDENKATPLHVALYNDDPTGDSETLDLLYKATKDKSKNLIDKNGMSFFHVAASRNDFETVKMYLDQGEDVNQKIGKDEYYGVSYFTPLHFAVQYRHQEMVELLIERGADVNSPSIDRPLHIACEYGHQGIIELLLLKGAKADKKAGVWRDETPLHLLLQHISDHRWAKLNAGDCKDEQEMFDKDFNRKLELFHACFKKLLEAGCDINARDKDGDTALHYACATRLYYFISVQKLLWLGADVNVENKKGKTPLEMRNFEWYDGHAEGFMVLYHHVQELKALGMEVNPKNEEYCKKLDEKKAEWSKHENWNFNGEVLTDKVLAARNKQRLDEMEKMKKVMLTKKVSLHDFVKFGPKRTGITVKNAKLRKVMEEANNEGEYSVYWYRIWLHWNEALKILKDKVLAQRKRALQDNGSAVTCKRICV